MNTPFVQLRPRHQFIRTAPQKILVGSYLTAKGRRLQSEGASDEVLAKYRKNRYAINPDSKQGKQIYHPFQS